MLMNQAVNAGKKILSWFQSPILKLALLIDQRAYTFRKGAIEKNGTIIGRPS